MPQLLPDNTTTLEATSEKAARVPSDIDRCISSNIILSAYVADAPNSSVDIEPISNDSTSAGDVSVIATNKPETFIYDATGFVPHYKNPHEAPDYMQKYISKATTYFSLYHKGCQLDWEGWYSVTPERMADHIAERCRGDTILDAFCGVGGNAIAFAKTCKRVISLDTDPTRLALAQHNATIYGVADRIEFILADYRSWAHSYFALPMTEKPKIDVVFLDPPWGGPEYDSSEIAIAAKTKAELSGTPYPEYSLASIQPIHGAQLFELSSRITCNIAYFLPRGTILEEISALVENGQYKLSSGRGITSKLEMVEVEEQWMNDKLKAITCYFGGLVRGQEDLL